MNQRAEFGSFCAFFGQEVTGFIATDPRLHVHQEREKTGELNLSIQVLLFVMKRRRLNSSYWPERLSSSSLTRNLR